MKIEHLLAPLALAALCAPAPAQVGEPMPEVELEGFANTEAGSYDDLLGRAVLIEFFAHW